MRIDKSKFRGWEIYSRETVKAPVIVRMDGRGFHRVADECGMESPFDERFHKSMIETAKALMMETGFNISIAYTASDEISLLFLSDSHVPFNGRIEKILSILPSYASSFLQNCLKRHFSYEKPISFDARIVKVSDPLEILEYFRWRCLNAFRNFLNAYANKVIGREETFRMKGHEIIKELYKRGFDIQRAPKWQRYGTLIYWRCIESEGYNPITRRRVRVKRRRIYASSLDLTVSNGISLLKNLLSR
ncbi:tRNA 5'-guanylyltransferase [Candidatus Bathyarchaeota archaeon]|nr:MAG: tRNA 5'-guanylyltransferase [Candidatus Bathyarchaeota archaeon]HDM88882.1 tRNA 5'-guanylyltransferase [Candidatus Bathyarchaeota archaeon]